MRQLISILILVVLVSACGGGAAVQPTLTRPSDTSPTATPAVQPTDPPAQPTESAVEAIEPTQPTEPPVEATEPVQPTCTDFAQRCATCRWLCV